MNEILSYTETVYHVGMVFGLHKNYTAEGKLKNPKKIVKLAGEDSYNMYFKDSAFMAGRAVCDIEEVKVLQRNVKQLEDTKTGKIITKTTEYKVNAELTKIESEKAKSYFVKTKESPKDTTSSKEVEELKRQISELTKAFEKVSSKKEIEEPIIEEVIEEEKEDKPTTVRPKK